MLPLLTLIVSLQLTPAQIRAAVDTWLTNRWTAIKSNQDNYLASHGRYFQGLWTHEVLIPSDGIETVPDNVLTKPTDQADRWADVISLPLAMPCRLRIDTYHGPSGRGFVATLEVKIGLRVWSRSTQVGPESWRELAWHQVSQVIR